MRVFLFLFFMEHAKLIKMDNSIVNLSLFLILRSSVIDRLRITGTYPKFLTHKLSKG